MWKIRGYKDVRDGGRRISGIKRDLVCNGPIVSCAYYHWDPGRSHCILIVGWNATSDIWIIKNSWGTGWVAQEGATPIGNGFGTIPYDHGWTRTEWWEVCEKWYPYGVYKD